MCAGVGRSQMTHPPVVQVKWSKAWRIIPSRFPPIDVFETLGNSDLLAELEGLTNPRLREQWGEISLVPPERRVNGPGATFVMAPFTHPNKLGSRFSSGQYGIYYAASSMETAIAETVHHMTNYYTSTKDAPHQNQFRCLIGRIDHALHDLISKCPEDIRNPDDYAAAQALGKSLRDAGSDGIIYESIRNPGSENIAAFWPDVVGIPIQERHLAYNWNGREIDKIFDYETEQWMELVA